MYIELVHFFFTAPSKVDRPEIEKIEKGNIKFSLRPASEVNGGISHYYLIVVPILNSTVLRRPQDYQFDEVFIIIRYHYLIVYIKDLFSKGEGYTK